MARTRICSGICGFVTEVDASSEDLQHVVLQLSSNCPDVIRIAKQLGAETFDAYEEIGPCKQAGSVYETRIMRICGDLPHAACPVPPGICKALEVAAGLALPCDASIEVFRDDDTEESASK